MKNCLVCNRLMKTNKKEVQNPKDECLGHEEHIIQNALGGRLKAYGVLCIDCGGTVNKTIDSAFINLFAVYTSRMDKLMKRDRPPASNASVKGFHNKLNFSVKLDNGVLVPSSPKKDYDPATGTLHIYAHKKIIDNYEKQAIKEAKEEHGFETCNVIKYDSFKPSKDIELFFSKGNASFNSQMAKGLTKIAVEYAYHEGVERKYLEHHIDSKNRTFNECKSIYMYAPLNTALLIMDYFRDVLDENYPNHTVMLYTIDFGPENRNLYCYIELFGTFQYYVLLKAGYEGPQVNTSFAQRLRAKDKIDYRLDSMEYEELYCFAKENKIDISEVDFTHDLNVLRSFIEKKMNSKISEYPYDLKTNINDQIKKLLNKIITKLIRPETDCELTEYIEKLPDAVRKVLFNDLRQMISEPDAELIVYRQKIINKQMEMCSMADEVADGYESDQNPSIDFGHLKAEMLDYYLSLYDTKES